MLQKLRKNMIISVLLLAVSVLFMAPVTYAAKAAFPDVKKTDSHYEAIVYLAGKGVVNGYASGKFGTWDPVKRQQAASMMARTLNLKEPQNAKAIIQAYQDVNIQNAGYRDIAAVANAGILKGNNGFFYPSGNLTREQMATILVRGFKLDQIKGSPTAAVNLKNVSASHKENVQILANLGITATKKDFRPSEPVSRGAFATLVYKAEKIANQPAASVSALTASEKKVVDLTNKERTSRGLKPLKVDEELSKVAQDKSRDMKVKGYFDHNSPTYGSPFDMMDAYGIKYMAAGENIAMGYGTPEAVVKAWMNSPGHRANILSDKFTHIGIGFEKEGQYWTQHFIGK